MDKQSNTDHQQLMVTLELIRADVLTDLEDALKAVAVVKRLTHNLRQTSTHVFNRAVKFLEIFDERLTT